MDSTNYSKVSNIDPRLVEVSIGSVMEGDAVLFNDTWYKALEDSHEENGYLGFKAENESFETTVVQVRKNDMGYAPKLYMERELPTDTTVEDLGE